MPCFCGTPGRFTLPQDFPFAMRREWSCGSMAVRPSGTHADGSRSCAGSHCQPVADAAIAAIRHSEQRCAERVALCDCHRAGPEAASDAVPATGESAAVRRACQLRCVVSCDWDIALSASPRASLNRGEASRACSVVRGRKACACWNRQRPEFLERHLPHGAALGLRSCVHWHCFTGQRCPPPS